MQGGCIHVFICMYVFHVCMYVCMYGTCLNNAGRMHSRMYMYVCILRMYVWYLFEQRREDTFSQGHKAETTMQICSEYFCCDARFFDQGRSKVADGLDVYICT
jgi:hypothetical protein